VDFEIHRRIQTAIRSCHDLRKHLRSSHLAGQTKGTIYKTLICPGLLYSSETWVPTKREENLLLVFERSRYIFELDREFNSRNDMIRGAENLPKTYYLFRTVPEGRRNQGRPQSRWADGVNSDSRPFGGHYWTSFAQDRVQWRDFLRQAPTNSWLDSRVDWVFLKRHFSGMASF
jgi:hypothetical protein